MSKLQEWWDSLNVSVKFLPQDYNTLTTTELANGFCFAFDAEDDFMQNAFAAGICLKFWYLIKKLYNENGYALKMQIDDFICWINLSILEVCSPEERPWQKKTNMKAETAILQKLNTRYKASAYYDSNLHKHRANYNTMSLNVSCDSEDEEEWIDTLAEEELDTYSGDGRVEEMVQASIYDEKVLEAIILDTIALKDNETEETFKEVDEETGEVYKSKRTKFSRLKLIKNLKTLDDKYLKYFTSRYNVKYAAVKAALNKLTNAKNPVLYEYLDAATLYAKENFEF